MRKRFGSDDVIESMNDSLIMQKSTPVKMLIGCVLSCLFGIILMGITGQYVMMVVFTGLLLCLCITTPLLVAGKLSIEMACLIPMLLLCFVYTPISWFTFDGLLGSTPYISILLFAIITLTHYQKEQKILILLYATLMFGLTMHWLVTWQGQRDVIQVVNILVAYILTVLLMIHILEAVKAKNLEINQRMLELSMHDELTGLLNRRVSNQVFEELERCYLHSGTEYGAIMLDVDEFKAINDVHGHRFGDVVLKHVAKCIQMSIRSTDYAFRYGGDEFLILVPNMNRIIVQQTYTKMEEELHKMRQNLAPIFVSMGYAMRLESQSTSQLLELADKRMYEAKRHHCIRNANANEEVC